jgi:hypothetical protein
MNMARFFLRYNREEFFSIFIFSSCGMVKVCQKRKNILILRLLGPTLPTLLPLAHPVQKLPTLIVYVGTEQIVAPHKFFFAA